MTGSTPDRYMGKAQEALAAARLCFEHELYDSAVSRAYYAVF